jgi:hypothetical protein
MRQQETFNAPTSDEILIDLIKKQNFNKKCIELAKELQVFNISGKEYYISKVQKLHITFTNIENDSEEITRYIEDDLTDVKMTEYVLVPK